jgi:hypothetical protein
MGGAATGARFTFTDIHHSRESSSGNSSGVDVVPTANVDLGVTTVIASASLVESRNPAYGPPVGEVIPMRKTDDDRGQTDDWPSLKLLTNTLVSDRFLL